MNDGFDILFGIIVGVLSFDLLAIRRRYCYTNVNLCRDFLDEKGVCRMKEFLYGLYALGLGIVAFFTGEIVTFLMLGLILITLMNINENIKKLHDK